MADDAAVLDAIDTGTTDDGSQDDGTQDDGLDAAAVDDSQSIADDAGTDDAVDDDADPDAVDDDTAKDDDPAVTADGRKMPDALKKAISALKATSPEAAKQIKGLYYSEQAYREVFPKPEEAIAAKTLIEEVGGAEGIQQIHSEREEWNQIDRDFAEGKKEFVSGLAEGNPEAFLKTAPHVINEFASRAPEQYQYYANNVAVNTLASVGVSLQNLASAYNRYGDGTGKETPAQTVIAEIHGALSGLKKQATEYEQKRTDPREEQLKQKETAFEQKRRADFEGGVAGQAENYLKEKMQPEIDRVVAGRKIDPDAMKGYQKMVNDEVMRRLGEIPGFADKLEAHYRTGDQKKSVEYIQAQYNRILPEAAKVIAPFLRNIAPGKVAPKPGTAVTPGHTPSAGEVVLKDMPERNQIDWSKTTMPDVIQGKAVLTNGKRATWPA